MSSSPRRSAPWWRRTRVAHLGDRCCSSPASRGVRSTRTLLHIPLSLVLIGIVLPVRVYVLAVRGGRGATLLGWVFAIASLITPFLLGQRQEAMRRGRSARGEGDGKEGETRSTRSTWHRGSVRSRSRSACSCSSRPFLRPCTTRGRERSCKRTSAPRAGVGVDCFWRRGGRCFSPSTAAGRPTAHLRGLGPPVHVLTRRRPSRRCSPWVRAGRGARRSVTQVSLILWGLGPEPVSLLLPPDLRSRRAPSARCVSRWRRWRWAGRLAAVAVLLGRVFKSSARLTSIPVRTRKCRRHVRLGALDPAVCPARCGNRCGPEGKGLAVIHDGTLDDAPRARRRRDPAVGSRLWRHVGRRAATSY